MWPPPIVAPQDLYKGGLQRERFLPFIDLIQQKLDVLDIGAGRDFRLDRLKGDPVWHTPLGSEATAMLDKAFATLTDDATPHAEEIELQGRTLIVERTARGIARFIFDELCNRPPRRSRFSGDRIPISHGDDRRYPATAGRRA